MNARIAVVSLMALWACSDPSATVVPAADGTNTVIGIQWAAMSEHGGNEQVGQAGEPLGQPLAVVVRIDGAPRAGVAVRWTTLYGTMSPVSAITDAEGIARSVWTVGGTSGNASATASITLSTGVVVDRVTFVAQVGVGPAVSISKLYGDGRSLAANSCKIVTLGVTVYDRFHNPVPANTAVTWTIEGGPATIHPVYLVGPTTWVRATGTTGVSRVRAALTTSPATYVEFLVSIIPVQYDVYYTDNYDDNYYFDSAQTCAEAPTDTIPVGATMKWSNYSYGVMSIRSVGEPSFANSPSIPSGGSYSVQFPVAGTYRYADAANANVTGTIIVR